MFAEFIEIAIVGALFTTLLLGGYNLPYMDDSGFPLPGGTSDRDEPWRGGRDAARRVPGKVVLVCSFQILVRWSLPRFRYDQVMRFAWKFMMPLALINLTRHRRAAVVGPGSTAVKTPYPRKQYWNAPTLTRVGAGLPARDPARSVHHQPRVPAQHGALITGRKGALTTYYPEETRFDYAPLNRGSMLLTQRPDGKPQCIACNMCANGVPGQGDRDRGRIRPHRYAHPKYPVRFEIDYSRCVFCGLCVEACPEDAIRMAKETPGLPSDDRHQMWLTLDEMLTWQPQPMSPSPTPRRRQEDRGCRMIEALLQNLDTLLLVLFAFARWRARC